MNGTETAVISAARDLQALSGRLLKNGVSVARLAVEFATLGPSLACAAALRYASSNGIAADEVRRIVEDFESQQDQKAKDRRNRQRASAARHKVRSEFLFGREQAVKVEWTVEAILESARRRRDMVAAAVATIESGRDTAKHELTACLGNYLKSDNTMWQLERGLGERGYSVEGAKVIPLVPLPARRSAS